MTLWKMRLLVWQSPRQEKTSNTIENDPEESNAMKGSRLFLEEIGPPFGDLGCVAYLGHALGLRV